MNENRMDSKELKLQEILEYYKGQNVPADQGLLVEMLREIQEVYGFLPTDLMPEIAEASGMKESIVRKLVKLYPSLKFADYAHTIRVCTGVNCSRESAGGILDELLEAVKEYGPAQFKVVTGACLKSCATAPNCMIDGDLYTNVKAGEIKGMLRKYR